MLCEIECGNVLFQGKKRKYLKIEFIFFRFPISIATMHRDGSWLIIENVFHIFPFSVRIRFFVDDIYPTMKKVNSLCWHFRLRLKNQWDFFLLVTYTHNCIWRVFHYELIILTKWCLLFVACLRFAIRLKINAEFEGLKEMKTICLFVCLFFLF